MSLAYTENVTTVTAHLQPAFALQLGLGYKVQVRYRFLTDRPRPKRNQRQEGTPPSWPRRLRIRVRTRSITGRYGTRPRGSAAGAQRKCMSSELVVPFPVLHTLHG